MTISERIFDIMRIKNLKQKDLSAVINIPTATISTWNTRNTSPPAEKIAEIADYLGVSVYYLLGLTDNPNLVVKNNGYVMKTNQTNVSVSNGDNIINNNPAQSSNETIGELDKHDRELLEEYHKLSLKNKAKVISLITELEEDNN